MQEVYKDLTPYIKILLYFLEETQLQDNLSIP